MTLLLRRLAPPAGQAQTRYAEVTDAWAGQTVVCMATGPSLTAAQVARARDATDAEGRRVYCIAVNDAYLLAPWAPLLYFADAKTGKWLDWHRDRAEFKAFAGQKCMIDVDAKYLRADDDIHLLRAAAGPGISGDRQAVYSGSNSGHQALVIATLAQPALILLLGYDAKKAADSRVHFFGNHPDRSFPPYEAVIKNMMAVAGPIAKLGIRVVNCTPGSAIDCFERGDLASVLPDPAAAVVSA